MRFIQSTLLGVVLCLLLAASAIAAQPLLTLTGTDAKLGGVVHATGTLSGGEAPTGSITFSIFGPGDPTCAGAAASTSEAIVNGNGEYDSADFAPTELGTYHWSAVYPGDGENDPANALCSAISSASQATPELSSNATNGTVGGAIKDTANLAVGFNPTGTLTFEAFGPGDATCGGAAAFTKTVPVAGNGAYGSTEFTTVAAGDYRWTVEYSGDTDNTPATSPCNAANEKSTVAKAAPTLSSTATSAIVGAAIKDTATLAAGFNPSGTLTFKAFGPADATCANAAAFTKAVSVSGNAAYGSTDFTNNHAGEYKWTVEYSGDANNASATSPCGAANETSSVSKASPTLSSTATSATVGAAIKDTATLSGGVGATGSLVFKAFGPADATCANAAAFTKTVSVAGNAGYDSTGFSTSAAGTYKWTVEYSGDADNNAATSVCGAANETSTVSKASPALASNATNGTAGGTIKDTATLATGFTPTGSLVFKAFGPNNATCTGVPAFTKENVAVNNNGSYESTSFPQPLAGEYRWTVSYSGDANNNAASAACNSANSISTVAKAAPTLGSTATNGTAGGSIKDTATLTGVAVPTGTLTFKAFGPADATCANAAAFTKAVTVSGNASYDSTDFTNPLAGAYKWTVEYSGDANNAAATSPCGAANETSTVSKASPTLSSTATGGVVGTTIKDTATLASGANPTGSLVFKAFGPSNATCTGAAAITKTVPIAGNGVYGSGDAAVTIAGDYRWTIEYAGDANNNASTSPCNAANEKSTVSAASPTIASVATGTVFPGTISDTATLAGGFNPSGTLTFKAFGPNDPTCANAAAFEQTLAATGSNGDFKSTTPPNLAIGEYRWTVEYSGDADDNPATSACNAANGTSTIAKVPVQIAVTTANAAIGGSIASFATFSGGISHTGQVVFRAFGPNDATCSGAAAFVAALPVTAGNGTYASGQFTPATAGAYYWTAAYSGDATNAAATTSCAAAVATVAPATPTLAAHLSPAAISIGEAVRSTATLAAGFKPGGTLSFSLFGPGNTACSGAPESTASVAVTANGSYTSPAMVPGKAGDYRFVVTYSGDASNTAVVASCGAGGEFVQVQKRVPTLKAKATLKAKKIVAKATLGEAASPRGKMTFRIYAPSDSRCKRKPVFSSQVAVKGATVTAAGYRFDRAGLYRFSVAYSGDERNQPVKTACTAHGQSIRVK